MAAPSFPQRKSQGAGGMTSPGAGASQLDGPPPSPFMPAGTPQTLSPGMPAGTPTPTPSFSQMAEPMTAGTPGRALAPEIVLGVYQGTETIYGMLDSFASIVPDLANDYSMIKDLLLRTTGKLVTNSGVSAAPASTGTNFPGGGFLSGAQ